MESSRPQRVLVVAHRTAATPALHAAVRERAARGPATFALLVPATGHGLHRVTDPGVEGDSEARAVIDAALPGLQDAAGGPVEGYVGDPDPLAAIQDAITLHGAFDELLISTLPRRLSKWLHLDLPHKAAVTGLPVTTVTPEDDGAATA
jgi:hypothetical protein